MQQRRGKRKRYSRDDLSRMRNVKADKWEKKRIKTAKIRDKITRFDKYDQGSCSADYLWWDLITNQSAADDIYEVREFRRINPHWDYRAFDDRTASAEIDQTDAIYDDAADELASSMNVSDDDYFVDAS